MGLHNRNPLQKSNLELDFVSQHPSVYQMTSFRLKNIRIQDLVQQKDRGIASRIYCCDVFDVDLIRCE